MPLPIPQTKEKKDEFISRCVHELAHENGGYRWPKNSQRLAVCYIQWEKKNEDLEQTYLPKCNEDFVDKLMDKYLINQTKSNQKPFQKNTNHIIIEESKSTDDIIIALGGPNFFKKFKSLSDAMFYINKNVKSLESTFNVKISISAIKTALKKMGLKEKHK